jgi:hypothetical protein
VWRTRKLYWLRTTAYQRPAMKTGSVLTESLDPTTDSSTFWRGLEVLGPAASFREDEGRGAFPSSVESVHFVIRTLLTWCTYSAENELNVTCVWRLLRRSSLVREVLAAIPHRVQDLHSFCRSFGDLSAILLDIANTFLSEFLDGNLRSTSRL